MAWGAELIQSELLSNFSILEPAIESNFTFGAVVNFGNGSATVFVNGSTNEGGNIVVVSTFPSQAVLRSCLALHWQEFECTQVHCEAQVCLWIWNISIKFGCCLARLHM